MSLQPLEMVHTFVAFRGSLKWVELGGALSQQNGYRFKNSSFCDPLMMLSVPRMHGGTRATFQSGGAGRGQGHCPASALSSERRGEAEDMEPLACGCFH